VTASGHDHSHSHDASHPHADLSADASEPVERAALRTQNIAEFLEAHFGSVEIAETEATEEGKIMFEPSIVVRLDDLEARVGLIDLVRSVRV
jgi:Pre-mRNA 3'-end-processing endonuclease polyadenylation factor C-term